MPLHKIIFNYKHLCTKEQVQEIVDKAFKNNNKLRDNKWEERFFSIQDANTKQHSKLREDFLSSIQKHIEHLRTSPETSDKLGKISITCAQRGVEISNMTDDIKDIKDSVKEIKDFNSKLLEKLDNRYASKEIETSLKRINWVVIVAVIMAVLALILKQ